MKFNFHFGKPNKKNIIIFSITISIIISSLSQCTKISEDSYWDLLDEIQRKYFPQSTLNEIIIKDNNKLERRIKRDVTSSIEKVTKEYDEIIKNADKKYKPKFIEEENNSLCTSDNCKKLLPSMRICSHWIDDCK